jgi:nucleoside-diphosphate-sugar epimerase
VDEQQSPAPGTDRGRRRAHAEQLIQTFAQAHQLSWAIARVPAIYGPQRLPIARLKAGTALPDPKDTGPGNRIHVEDLVSALVLMTHHPKAHAEIFNVSDQNPIPTAEFLTEIANQLNIPIPAIKPISELTDALSPQLQSFMGEQKIINAQKIVDLLGFMPEFKDYREGIAQSLRSTSPLKQLGD